MSTVSPVHTCTVSHRGNLARHATRSDLRDRDAALFVLSRLYSPLESALETRRTIRARRAGQVRPPQLARRFAQCLFRAPRGGGERREVREAREVWEARLGGPAPPRNARDERVSRGFRRAFLREKGGPLRRRT
jgi:hypothetical protein